MSTNSRNKHIDICKGFGILIVVFGHNWIVLNSKGELFNVIFSFHMPLFFLLSGIFLKPTTPLILTISSKSDALLKPYFVTTIALALAYIILKGESIIYEVVTILYTSGDNLHWIILWFLPHLFAVTIFSWGFINLVKKIPKSDHVKYVLLGFLLAVGVTFIELFWKIDITLQGNHYVLLGLPFGLDIVPVSAFYFLLGYYLKDRILDFKSNHIFTLLALFLFVALHYFFDYTIDLNSRKYDDILITTAQALCGIYLIFSLSYILQHSAIASHVFSYIGSCTLIILIFHNYILKKSYNIASSIFDDSVLIPVLTSFIAACVIPIIIHIIIKRFSVLSLLYFPLKSNALIKKYYANKLNI